MWLARVAVVLTSCAVMLGGPAVATASGGSDCASEHLFDCRAYELVSPAYKEGFAVEVTGVSETGSKVLAQSPGTFSAPEGTTALGQEYEITREATGWKTNALAAASTEFSFYSVEEISPDFQASLWLASPPGVGVRGVYLGAPSKPMDLVRVGPAEPSTETIRAPTFIGGSEDLRHILFSVPAPFSNGEPTSLWPGDTTTTGRSLYEYNYTGIESDEPELVGISNAGVPASVGAGHLISNCGIYLGGFPEGDAYNAISTSGETIFFTAASCGGAGPAVNEVYARIDRKSTLAISEPPLSVPGRECTGTCALAESDLTDRKAGVFAGASLDGSKVFFTTAQPLVNSDTDNSVDLYEAEIKEGSLSRLSQVSRGGEGDPTPGSGADVLGVARVSEDGSHVYFVAEGILTGANKEGESPLLHEPNLYVFSSECPEGETSCVDPAERTSFVATLSKNDERDWSGADKRPVQATPNGRFCCFQSVADLTPDQEGTEAGQVFEYDAQTETLVRVSKGREGYDNNGNSSSYGATILTQDYDEIDESNARFLHLAMTADGSRVFFASEDALTPQALSGVVNVYEYHDGQVGLISDGHDIVSTLGQPAVELIGTDESGLDVFFTTADRLVPQDTNDQVDIYDARMEGGFSPEGQAPCTGDSCQDASNSAPTLLEPVTSSIIGEIIPSGILKSTATSKKKPEKKAEKKHKTKTKKTRETVRHRHTAKRARHGNTARAKK